MNELLAVLADYATILFTLIYVGGLVATFYVKYKESIKKRLWPWQFVVSFLAYATIILLVHFSTDSLLVTFLVSCALILSIFLIPNKILKTVEERISISNDALAVASRKIDVANADLVSTTLYARFLLSCMDEASLHEAQRLAKAHKTFFDQPLASPPDYEKFASVFQDDDTGTIAQTMQSFSEEEFREIHCMVRKLIYTFIDNQQGN